MANMIDAALWYAEEFQASIFPVNEKTKFPLTKNGVKDASKSVDQIKTWWTRWPNANIGLATGQPSDGLVVVDLDIDEEKGLDGYDTLREWERANGELPDTVRSITGRGGNHLFFRTNRVIKNRAGILEGIDIRGDGGYVIVPPSIHQNGNRYEWEQSPDEYDVAMADDTLFKFLSIGTSKKQKAFELTASILPGQRNDSMYRLACSLQAKGLANGSILQTVMSENESKCSPPLEAEEVERIVESALKYEKGKFPAINSDKEDVRQLLSIDKNGNALQTIENCITILEEDKELAGNIGFNELTYAIHVFGDVPWNKKRSRHDEWQDVDDKNLIAYMEKTYGIKNKENILTALDIVANEERFNPICEWLNKLPEWDGVYRIETFLNKYLGATQSKYSAEIMKIFLLGAVSRAYEPGCKFDYTLMLEGAQGCGKSTFVRKLAMSNDWFTDNLNTLEGDKGVEKLSGIWIAELGELLAFKRQKDVEAIKAFLTSTCDNYRPPYARRVQKRPRRCVFVGTTNSNHFLTDLTGNRRYLPIHCDRSKAQCSIFDGEDLEFQRDIVQVWAEALYIYKNEHPRLVLPKEIEAEVLKAQENYLEEDVRVGVIQDYLDKKLDSRVCILELWEKALNELGKPSRKDSNTIHDIMKSGIVGWKPVGRKRTAGYGNQICYERVEEYGKASRLNDETF